MLLNSSALNAAALNEDARPTPPLTVVSSQTQSAASSVTLSVSCSIASNQSQEASASFGRSIGSAFSSSQASSSLYSFEGSLPSSFVSAQSQSQVGAFDRNVFFVYQDGVTQSAIGLLERSIDCSVSSKQSQSSAGVTTRSLSLAISSSQAETTASQLQNILGIVFSSGQAQGSVALFFALTTQASIYVADVPLYPQLSSVDSGNYSSNFLSIDSQFEAYVEPSIYIAYALLNPQAAFVPAAFNSVSVPAEPESEIVSTIEYEI